MTMSAAGRCLLALLTIGSMTPVRGVVRHSEKYFCPRSGSWSFLEATTQGVLSPLCYSIGRARSFQEALTSCHTQHARVFSLSDYYSDYLTLSGESLVDLLASNGVTHMWHGFYVKDGRLRKDTFPLSLTTDSEYMSSVFSYIPWDESGAEGLPTGSSDCFEIAINLTATAICVTPGIDLPNFGDDGSALSPSLVANEPGLEFTPKSELQSDQETPELGFDSRRRRAPATESDVVGRERRRNRAKLGRTKRQSFAEDGLGFCKDGKVLVKSRHCNDRLPFVCVKPALEKSTVTLGPLETLCQTDEIGNAGFSRCFSFGVESVDHATARARCEAKGAQSKRPRTLYRPLSLASSSFLNGLITDAIAAQISVRNPTESLPGTAMAWVDGSQGSEECLALSLDRQTNATVSWDCSARLPFYICQSSVYLPGASKLTFKVSNVAGLQITDIPGSNDKQVTVPYAKTIGNARVTPTISCTYGSSLVPDLQSMMLVKGGVPVAELRGTGQFNGGTMAAENNTESGRISMELGNLQDPAVDDNLADYYWCEINDLRTGKIHQSDRVFIRAKEVEMYAASIAINPVYPPRPQLVLDSLTGLYNSWYGLTRELNNIMTSQSSTYSFRLLRFRPELFPKNSTRAIVDFYFFNTNVGQALFRPTNRTTLVALASIKTHFPSDTDIFTESITFGFDIQSLQVRSIDICPYTSVYDPISEKTYEVMDTELGETYKSPEICLSNAEPFVTLNCEGDKLYGARWSRFEPNEGCNFTNAVTSVSTNTLKNISKSVISDDTLNDIIEETSDTVSQIDSFVPVDVVYLADILQQTVEVDNIPAETGQVLLRLADKVTTVNDTILEESNMIGNATNRIIHAINDLGYKVAFDNADSVRLVSDTVAVEIWDLTKATDDVIVGLELKLDGGESVPVLNPWDLVSLFESASPSYTETDAAIFLPGEFVRKVQQGNPGKDVRLVMNVFAETALFKLGRLQSRRRNSLQNATLNSKVISATVMVDGDSVSELDTAVVTTVYLPIIRSPLELRAEKSTCVFWDFAGAEGHGAWSDKGCIYDRTWQGRDVCVCDHLTNFAVLLDLYGQSALPQEHQLALSIITIIGLSVSIAGLAVTVLSFLLIKKLRQGKPQQTLFNMALAMLASWIIFLAGFTRVESHVGCLAVAALLHYFILASFMWMLMEGVLQYLLFVKVLGNDFDNYMLKTALPAWGLPLIPVVVVLAIDTELYRGGDQYCWMSLTPFYYAFLAPVLLVMLINIAVYIMVVVSICRRGNLASSGTSKRAVGIRASVACFIILGLSWVFAFFAIEDARVVFQYLFTITTSLQGLLIFLVFTARDPAVRAFWRQACCGPSRPDKSGTDKTRTQSKEPRSSGSDHMPLGRSKQSSGDSEGHVQTRRNTAPTYVVSESSGSGNGPGLVNHAYNELY